MVEEEPPKPMEEAENVMLIEGASTDFEGRIGEVFEKELGCLCMEPREHARDRQTSDRT